METHDTALPRAAPARPRLLDLVLPLSPLSRSPALTPSRYLLFFLAFPSTGSGQAWRSNFYFLIFGGLGGLGSLGG